MDVSELRKLIPEQDRKSLWENLLRERDLLRLELASPGRRPQAAIQSDLSVVKTKIKVLQRELQEAGTDRHQVSDHALVRYLERIHGIDVGRLKDLIFEKHCSKQIADGSRFIASAGHVFVVSADKVVVTVIPQQEAA